MSKNTYDYNTISAGYYDQIFHRRHGMQGFWHDAKFRFVKKLIQHHQGKLSAINLLDVGCGPGTFIGNFAHEAALKMKVSAVGIDIAPAQIDYAKAHYGNKADFQVYDGKIFPFPSGTFDTITLIEVIEHLPNDILIPLMAECKRCLKPDGKIIVTTPNYHSLWPILEWLLGKLSPVSYNEQHITHFYTQNLIHFFKEAGFSPAGFGSYPFIAPFAASASWSLARFMSRFDILLSSLPIGFLLYGVFQYEPRTRDER